MVQLIKVSIKFIKVVFIIITPIIILIIEELKVKVDNSFEIINKA